MQQDVPIEEVVNSGPGLVFITYPEVVLKLPGGPIWAVTFFLMLVVSTNIYLMNFIIVTSMVCIANATLQDNLFFLFHLHDAQTIGIDSEFCIVESLVTGIVDMWPDYLRPRRRKFTAGR